MAVTLIECPHCGRVGSTSREIPVGARIRCPGCGQLFKYCDPESPSEPSASSFTGPVESASSEWASRPFPGIDPDETPKAPAKRTTRPGWVRPLLVGLAFIAVGGLGWTAYKAIPPKLVIPVVLTTAEVADRCEASVAAVSDGKRGGTGFLVADGLLATNVHVIESMSPDEIFVSFPIAPEIDRGPVLGRVVYYNQGRDLAILRVSSRLKPLPMIPRHAFRRGEDVVIIGNPTVAGTALECVVSRAVLGSKIGSEADGYYQISGSVNPGNSGGPVIDLFGNVVGVVTLKALKQEGIAFCIPPDALATATREASTASKSSQESAATEHYHDSKVGSARVDDIEEAMRRTKPSTWLAMGDVGYVLTDRSRDSASMFELVQRVCTLYKEDQESVVRTTFRMQGEIRESIIGAKAREILAGSIDYTSMYRFQTNKSVKYEDFALYYRNERTHHDSHMATMIYIRECEEFTKNYDRR